MPVDELREHIHQVLAKHFAPETIAVTPTGFGDQVSVVVTSTKFDKKSEKEKQDYLWGLLDKSDLSDEEKSKIAMIVPYTPSELW